VSDTRTRCSWCGDDELYVDYHDLDWGVPVRGDDALFELLSLEGAQAGLSWITVLRRREGYRRLFRDFHVAEVARFDDASVDVIASDAGVIRHRQKIDSVITNARAIIEVQRTQGPFSEYLWALGLADGDTIAAAATMSARLRKDGFKFVGPTICLSLMQASGMVNAHAPECFRFDEIEAMRGRR
jgi:DNA-3-methyladenine glycosylase I